MVPVAAAAALAALGFVVQALAAFARAADARMSPVTIRCWLRRAARADPRAPAHRRRHGHRGVGGTAAIAGWPALATLRQGPFERASSYTLLIIPLFIFMGYVASQAGLSQGLFRAAHVWLGHRRGGLAMATVAGCAGFGAICGSSVATGATMCSVALPEMRRYRYADSLSTGSIAAGGTLGIMIPPSIIFVLYGIMTEQSIGKLLMSGVLPGIVETFLFIIAIALVTAWWPGLGAPAPAGLLGRRAAGTRDIWEVGVLFAIVIGGIYYRHAGESAAFSAVGALAFGLARRRLSWRG
jgi:tripartite ATP-independent transporter DctM subunit